MSIWIRYLSLVGVIFVAGCASSLSPAAARLMTIQDGGVMAMMDCQQLGYVSGNSGIWGGAAGFESALTDVKNKAAQLPNANAILITSSRMNPTAYVNATVFNCSERATQKIEIVNQEPETIPQPEVQDAVMRKARLCQQHGGVWINDQCFIEIK